MNRSRKCAAAILLVSALGEAPPVGTAFTHQGRLTDGGNPACN